MNQGSSSCCYGKNRDELSATPTYYYCQARLIGSGALQNIWVNVQALPVGFSVYQFFYSGTCYYLDPSDSTSTSPGTVISAWTVLNSSLIGTLCSGSNSPCSICQILANMTVGSSRYVSSCNLHTLIPGKNIPNNRVAAVAAEPTSGSTAVSGTFAYSDISSGLGCSNLPSGGTYSYNYDPSSFLPESVGGNTCFCGGTGYFAILVERLT